MLRNKPARFLLPLAAALMLAAGQASAGQPSAAPETQRGKVEMLDLGAHKIRIAGATYDLASGVGLQLSSGQRLAFNQLQPGMTVKFQVVAGRNGSPVIQQLVLMPN